MFTLIADTTSAVSIAYPIGGGALFVTMLALIRIAAKAEGVLRKAFADERAARELEFTADYARQKDEYSASLIRHQQIFAAEVAALQTRITGYIDKQGTDSDRISVLEAEVRELRAR